MTETERDGGREMGGCDEASDLQLGELEVLEELPWQRGERILWQVSAEEGESEKRNYEHLFDDQNYMALKYYSTSFLLHFFCRH